MGSGKSIFGKKIASIFNVEHIDTDSEISISEQSTINDIFAFRGERHFRKIEVSILNTILKKKNVVISLGGGSILSKTVRELLNEHSLTVFLDVKLNTLKKRLKSSKNRPLLKDTNILTALKELDEKRRKYYLNADIVIDNSISSKRTLLTLKNILLSLNG